MSKHDKTLFSESQLLALNECHFSDICTLQITAKDNR